MAKTKQPLADRLNLLPQIPTGPNKLIKEGGVAYTLITPITIPGFKFELPANETTLVECQDGWFAIFIKGDKKYFRLGPKFINGIKEKLQNDTDS